MSTIRFFASLVSSRCFAPVGMFPEVPRCSLRNSPIVTFDAYPGSSVTVEEHVHRRILGGSATCFNLVGAVTTRRIRRRKWSAIT